MDELRKLRATYGIHGYRWLTKEAKLGDSRLFRWRDERGLRAEGYPLLCLLEFKQEAASSSSAKPLGQLQAKLKTG